MNLESCLTVPTRLALQKAFETLVVVWTYLSGHFLLSKEDSEVGEHSVSGLAFTPTLVSINVCVVQRVSIISVLAFI
jgi:hypothetical protein